MSNINNIVYEVLGFGMKSRMKREQKRADKAAAKQSYHAKQAQVRQAFLDAKRDRWKNHLSSGGGEDY